MPLKPEDINTALEIDPNGYEDVKSFVEDFGKKWRRAEDVPDIDAYKGKVNNVFRGKLKKVAKEHEIDLPIPDDGDPIDLVPEVAKRVAGKYEAKIADYEMKLKDASKGTATKEWEEKYGKLEHKYKETEGLLNGLNQKYSDLESSIAREKENAWVDNQFENAVSKVKWKQGISDYERKGFLSEFRGRVKVQRDDKGVPYATDADGNRIPDPAKPARFKELHEILADELKVAKLHEVHENGGKQVNRQTFQMNQPAPNPSGEPGPVRKLHPALGRQ